MCISCFFFVFLNCFLYSVCLHEIPEDNHKVFHAIPLKVVYPISSDDEAQEFQKGVIGVSGGGDDDASGDGDGAARARPFVVPGPEGSRAGKRKRHSVDGGREKKKKKKATVDSLSRSDRVLEELSRRGIVTAKDGFSHPDPLTLVSNSLTSLSIAARMREALRESDPDAEAWVPLFNLLGDFASQMVEGQREFFDFLLPTARLKKAERVPTLEVVDQADKHMMDFLTYYSSMRQRLV